MADDQLSRVLETLYAATTDPGGWTAALHAIEEFTGSAGAVMHLIGKNGSQIETNLIGQTLASRFSQEEVAEWQRDYSALCPRVKAVVEKADHPFLCDYLILEEAAMNRDPVYDWYGKHGLRYFIGSRVPDTAHFHVMWSLQRTRIQGHVQQRDIELFQLLTPHMAQAIRVADLLGTLTSQARFGTSMLDNLPDALLALSATGRILFGNRAAEALLADGDAITTRDGGLVTHLPAQLKQLERLVRDAAAPGAAGAGGWVRLSRRSGRTAYAVFVAPLIAEADGLMLHEAKVMVIIHDVQRKLSPELAALRQLYGLTQAEARLGCTLALGHNVASAAATLGIAVGTARAQLKSVFRKMEVNRQQDMLRMIFNGARMNGAHE